MLVLSRKVGERIHIGPNVVVTVVRLSGGGVRLGIEAPLDMAVVRGELAEAQAAALAEVAAKTDDGPTPMEPMQHANHGEPTNGAPRKPR